jgi:hypothetical protein
VSEDATTARNERTGGLLPNVLHGAPGRNIPGARPVGCFARDFDRDFDRDLDGDLDGDLHRDLDRDLDRDGDRDRDLDRDRDRDRDRDPKRARSPPEAKPLLRHAPPGVISAARHQLADARSLHSMPRRHSLWR